MKNSIELIWKEGFLNEKSLLAPKINDLYNQKSMHLVDRMKRMVRINMIALIGMAIGVPIFYYFQDVVWQGVAASVLLLLTMWYARRELRSLKTLDQGATSLDYLKSLDQWLKDTIEKTGKVARYSYPLYFLIGMSTIWSAWSKSKMMLKVQQQFPDLIYIWDVPLFALIIVGVSTLVIFYFSDKIYRWDVNLVYGRVVRKLEDTIAEMERLKG